MGKPSPPDPPDYSPLITASQNTSASDVAAAQIQADVAREQLGFQRQYAERAATTADKYAQMATDQQAFGRQQYDQLYPYLQKYMQSQLDFTGMAEENARTEAQAQQEALGRARESYQRYMTGFAPLEDRYAKEAFDYTSPARMEADAAAARGDVRTAFAAQEDAAKRQLMGYGVDPSEGAFGRTQAYNIAEAASEAAAGTQARRQTEAIGKSYQTAALEVGQKLQAQVPAYNTTAVNAAASGLAGATIGGGGVNAGGQALTAATNAMGSPTSYAALSNPYTSLASTFNASPFYGNQISALGNAGQVLGTAGNLMNNSFSNQMDTYRAQMAASPIPLIGQAIGTAAKIYTGMPAR